MFDINKKGECIKTDCQQLHVKGTKRKKPPNDDRPLQKDREKLPTNSSPSFANNQHNLQVPTSTNAQGGIGKATDDFLEIVRLLRKELEDLDAKVNKTLSSIEQRLAQLPATINPTPMNFTQFNPLQNQLHPLMFFPPPMTIQPPLTINRQ